MMRASLLPKVALGVALCTVPAVDAVAADTSRYPYENAAFAGELLGAYIGSHMGFLVTSVQIRLDPTFSSEQKGLIGRSMRILVERALQSNVLDCAFKNSTKDLPSSKANFEVQLYNALSPSYISGLPLPSFGFIARYHDDPGTVGLGYLSLYHDRDKPLPGYDHRHYFHVALNSDHMGSSSAYYYRDDAEYWAGVIVHEFLHNLGYNHPTGYTGSFIKEYGNCLAGNGRARMEIFGTLQDEVIEKDY